MNVRVLFMVSATVPVLLLASPVNADGKAFFRTGDVSSFLPLKQNEQRAAIVHSDGVERLLICINVDLQQDEEALWVFPVPGAPDTTAIDLVDTFPTFAGDNPFHQARDGIDSLMIAVRATQIYPFILEGCMMPHLGAARAALAVHTQVDKWGLRVEVISADSLVALAGYLEDKGSSPSKEQLQVFEPYLSDAYVLVVAWLSSREEFFLAFPDQAAPSGAFKGRQPCVYVEFATERAFYPMRPTSSYGQVHIPVTLFVMGYVKPATKSGGPGWVYASHYWLEGRPENAPGRFVAGLPVGRSAYTVITARGLANEYNEDLWFDLFPTPDTTYADIVGSLSDLYVAVPVGVLFVAILSYVAGGLTGLLMFGTWRRCAVLGLWNVLSLVVLLILISEAKGEFGRSLRQGCGKGFWRVEFWFLFTGIFMAMAIVAQVLLRWPLRG